jgi:hypothetical protein
VALELPQQSRTLVLSKPRSWYSRDFPTTDIGCLMSRPIPQKEFLSRLEEEAGQAWFDGCKSLLDPRYNDGSDRFPLWVLTFWKEMAELWDARWKWVTSVGWVDGQLEKELPDQDLEALMVRWKDRPRCSRRAPLRNHGGYDRQHCCAEFPSRSRN